MCVHQPHACHPSCTPRHHAPNAHRPQRALLGVLGITLRNPYPLHRQKAFIVPGIVPERYFEVLETVPTWDEWDPDQDRWNYDVEVK